MSQSFVAAVFAVLGLSASLFSCDTPLETESRDNEDPMEDPIEASSCDVPEMLPSWVAFQDIDVLDTDSGRLVSAQTVVIRDGSIVSVSQGTAPDGIPVIEGCGRVLAPGLADMHVHLDRDDLEAYLQSGVTSVRNLWGFPDLQAMQVEIASGALRGPTIYAISPGLDGTPPKWPLTQLIMDPADADDLVRTQAEAGWTALKLYQDLRPDVFDAVIEAANEQGLRYGGHVPHRVGLDRALDAGYRHIEHLSGYEQRLNPAGRTGAFAWLTINESLIPVLVQQTVEAGTWNCPTLEIFDQIVSGNLTIRTNRQRFVRALYDAGAPLLIGTDAGIGRTAPGRSLHEEMAQFVEAGLTPAQVLRIATVEAARYQEADAEFGQIRPGLRADLLLIDGNPLDGLAVLEQPEAVIARGVRVR